MKKLFILSTMLIFSLCTLSVFAQKASPEQAEVVCKNFILENYPGAVDKMPEFVLQETISENGMDCLYRFSVSPVGFVIVSASQSVMPVMAYSFDNEFEMIPPVRDLFHLYSQVVEFTEKGDAPVSQKSVADWKRYLADDFTPKADKSTGKGPLLTTQWNQSKYYNTYCPWDVQAGSYYDYRVPNGCVALASSQIMNYHRYPEHGVGGSTYVPQGYPRQTVNFTQHKYHWDAMCNVPHSYACEIAKLAYHFGVAIQMNYNYDGSGAQTAEARDQLANRFQYDQSIASYYRGFYVDSADLITYINILKGEIDARRPVYYSGCNQQMNSCHAYVLDGYDSDDKFSLNYGWGGASNGWYAIDQFVAGSSHFDFNSEAIVHIFPSGAYPDTYCQGHQRNTASFGYVADGSPTAKPYQANPDCSWMIAVPEATSYSFSFDRLDLNPDVDFVTIYNGPTVESGVKATLTGTTVPTQVYTVTADSVLITFTSNGSVETNTDYYGFLISYSSTVPAQQCPVAPQVVTDWTSILSDGSDDGVNYRPQSNCTWNVSLNYISGYSIAFPKFDLGYGDFVDVYNNTTTPPTLYKRFDIYEPPTGEVYNVNFKKMKVNFVSDNWDQKDGFRLEYFALASIDDHSGLEDLTVYPNPANDNIFVEFSLQDAAKVTCRLLDAAGKLVQTESVEAYMGQNKHAMNVSSLSNGFYMLEISTPTGKAIRKVMVQ